MSDQELAFLDAAFLESDEARPIRIMAEYLEPLRRFKAQNIQDTVVFFGSARIRSREKADDALGRLEQQLFKRSTSRGRAAGAPAAARPTQAQRLALTRARRAVTMSRYYEDARRLAHLLTEWSLSLGFEHHRFVVCSGGGPGIMEAANRGAFEAGGKSIGLNIKLPFEQGLNEYTTKGLGFQFHYFFMRKLWFAYLAKALVVFPGGFGTLDEMYEILTLAQTQKLSKKLAVVLYGPDYWNEVMDIAPMAKWGMISPDDLGYLQPASTPEEAFTILRDFLVANHLVPATTQEQKTPGHRQDAVVAAGRLGRDAVRRCGPSFGARSVSANARPFARTFARTPATVQTSRRTTGPRTGVTRAPNPRVSPQPPHRDDEPVFRERRRNTPHR